MIKPIVPSQKHHLTLLDVQKHATLTTATYDCPTRVISLENTLHITLLPLANAKTISKWARSRNPPLHMHLDGARLWEAFAAARGV